MSRESNDLNLNDRQKTTLLSLALDADNQEASGGGDEKRGDLLCDILRCPLSAHGFLLSGPFSGIRHSNPTLRSVCGPLIRELLAVPDTDISVLKRLKEYAKGMGKHAKSEVEKDVFLAVYFAAIAAARVFHDERITEHTNEDLSRFFRGFADAAWVTTNLAELFDKAAARCQEATEG